MRRATTARTKQSDAVLRRAFQTMGFEVIPFRRTEEEVVATIPHDVRLTVTASPAKGQDATVDLAARLTARGYTAAPHLSAALVRDRAHLQAVVDRCRDAGITEVFVVGGDRDGEPTTFGDALALLRALHELDHGFTEIGIGGHPEGHPSADDEVLMQAMADKAPLATSITTQIVFDPARILEWSRDLARRGITLPVHVGVPGAVTRSKLVRVSGNLGIGASATFLTKQQGMFWRFFRPGGYNPDPIIRGLLPHLGRPDNHLEGFHVFTFNDLGPTEEWRTATLRRTA
ncbi:methylenetetrahydrofolate reductase [Klenkia sp. LSe6-5]|uniref:Methylenetetrahydrofolate reductase n=1 Tax=Klenkia sesuvii TaxID=3103137 RepID=A0ABU8DQK0_9ACTN